jgi:hypothetical protein
VHSFLLMIKSEKSSFNNQNHLYCYGSNECYFNGLLGSKRTTTLKKVEIVKNIHKISAGNRHLLLLNSFEF